MPSGYAEDNFRKILLKELQEINKNLEKIFKLLRLSENIPMLPKDYFDKKEN